MPAFIESAEVLCISIFQMPSKTMQKQGEARNPALLRDGIWMRKIEEDGDKERDWRINRPPTA